MVPNKIPEVSESFEQQYDVLTNNTLKRVFRKARPTFNYFTKKKFFLRE